MINTVEDIETKEIEDLICHKSKKLLVILSLPTDYFDTDPTVCIEDCSYKEYFLDIVKKL